jgi:hypothetical protein
VPGKEFFHELSAHVGCDGKKAGLKECCAKILLSLSDIPENSGFESHELLICDSGIASRGSRARYDSTEGSERC